MPERATAYTIFNAYLPKLLESRGSAPDGSARSLEDSLWDVVIYAVGGCPGAIVRDVAVAWPDCRR